ncbi:MAG TPA: hypothetical protein DIS76_03245 [Rhodospirillaceae bacterium]|nr:hypothetical protein [Rhodospirillaceae bacterium]
MRCCVQLIRGSKIMSNTVSELGKNFYNGIIVRDLNYRLQGMMGQISTGKKAQTFGQLGTGTTTSLSLRSRYDGLQGYLSSINNVKLRTDSMTTAMTDMSNSTTDILAKMNAVSEGGVPDIAVLKNAAQNALSEILQRINSRVDGKYVFGADTSDKIPLTDTSLASTNIGLEVANYQTGTSAAAVITAIDALTDAQLGFNTDLAGAGDLLVRADDNLDINYTVKGNEDPFKDAIKGLSMLANLEYDEDYPDEFWTLFNEAKSRLDGGSRDIDLRNGQLGVARNQMNNLIKSHQDLQLVIETNISDVEDVDVAAVSASLQTLQFQIQATYATISQVTQLSILDYLR